jgi:hypothetical protein
MSWALILYLQHKDIDSSLFEEIQKVKTTKKKSSKKIVISFFICNIAK